MSRHGKSFYAHTDLMTSQRNLMGLNQTMQTLGTLWCLNSPLDGHILGTSRAHGAREGQTPALQLDYLDSPSESAHFSSSLTRAVSLSPGDKCSTLGHTEGYSLIGACSLKYCIPLNATRLGPFCAFLHGMPHAAGFARRVPASDTRGRQQAGSKASPPTLLPSADPR